MKWILPILVLVLSSCASTRIISKVKRLHTLPPQGSGQTFAIKNVTQVGDLELAHYNQAISAGLVKYGWKPSGSGAPDFKVNFMATRLGSKSIVVDDPIIGQTGGGTTRLSGSYLSYGGGGGMYTGTAYTQPTYGVVGMSSHRETVHSRMVMTTIIDRQGNCVFQADAHSVGHSPDLLRVVPSMIESIFHEFPGKSGEVYTHTIREH